MERISLHNYEAFFLDYMEGNLNAQQEFELLDFLDKNPELKADLDMDLDEIKLSPVALTPIGNEFLKKEGIQPEEAENLMIASVEGQLAFGDQVELQNYVEANNLQTAYKYYQHSVLEPNLSEEYGDNSDLKKKDRVLLPIFFRIAAGVVVAALLIGAYEYSSNSEAVADDVVMETSDLENNIEPIENDNISVVQDENKDEINTIEDVSENVSSVFKEVDLDNSSNNTDDHTNLHEEQHDQFSNDIDTIVKTQPNDKDHPIEEKEDEEIKDPQEEIKSKKDRNKDPKDNIITDEPIKVITDLAGNIFNRDIYYKRSTRISNGEKVVRHFKLGKFEFEQKKH